MQKILKFEYKTIIFIIIILSIIAVRFLSIKYVPDVFCDEEDILNHMNSISSSGVDTEGNKLPLFMTVGEGLSTYTYIYPMIILSKFCNAITPTNIRIIQQILTILSCYLIAKGIKRLTNNSELFRIILFTGLSLPWGFVQANRIWDPALVPLYFSLHFYFFTLFYNKRNYTLFNKKISSIINSTFLIISFSFLVLLAVVYPPCRIPAVAMWIFLIVFLFYKRKITITQFAMVVIASSILSLPLAINILFNSEFNQRASKLLIFNDKTNILKSIYYLIRNFFKLLSFKFLFIAGDNNYRHAVHSWGMLGFLTIIPLIKVLFTKIENISYYMIFTILFTFFSVSLTNDGMPHSLRSCLVWLPFTILIGYGWEYLLKNKSTKLKVIFQILSILSFITYLYLYYNFYTSL